MIELVFKFSNTDSGKDRPNLSEVESFFNSDVEINHITSDK